MENKNRNENIGVLGFVFSFFMPVVGLILSIIGLNKAKKNGTSNSLSVAGLAISAFRLLISFFVIVPLIFAAFLAFDEVEDNFDGHDFVSSICRKAYDCESVAGNMYKCTYDEDGEKRNIYCFENAVDKENIIEKDEPKDDSVDLSEFEELVSRHYIKYYDGLMDHAKAKELDNKIVEVTIYDDKEELKPGLVYSINRETLIGKDSHNYYVDLNEFVEKNNI